MSTQIFVDTFAGSDTIPGGSGSTNIPGPIGSSNYIDINGCGAAIISGALWTPYIDRINSITGGIVSPTNSNAINMTGVMQYTYWNNDIMTILHAKRTQDGQFGYLTWFNNAIFGVGSINSGTMSVLRASGASEIPTTGDMIQLTLGVSPGSSSGIKIYAQCLNLNTTGVICNFTIDNWVSGYQGSGTVGLSTYGAFQYCNYLEKK